MVNVHELSIVTMDDDGLDSSHIPLAVFSIIYRLTQLKLFGAYRVHSA